MRFGVVVFPGTWSDGDCHRALRDVLGQETRYGWHGERGLDGLDCVLLPGGFSYGDYLRPGAIATTSPVMEGVRGFAGRGGLVLGICNGFQVLCEAGLLPGALLPNDHLEFRCQRVHLRVERNTTPFTRECLPDQVLTIPISHGEGNYYADGETVETLEREGRVVLRYCNGDGEPTSEANPNGSVHNIAGIVNEQGNVMGMMPHPERAVEGLLGGTDGLFLLRSLVQPVASGYAS